MGNEEDLFFLDNSLILYGELNRMCDRAKVCVLNSFYRLVGHIGEKAIKYLWTLERYIGTKKSPIEEIYIIAVYYHLYKMGLEDIVLHHQYKIEIEDKKYFADFFVEIENNKFVIELDGFDYHSNKQQMNYDYEREQILTKNNYKVIRFTGSQIYNKPFTSALNSIEIVKGVLNYGRTQDVCKNNN